MNLKECEKNKKLNKALDVYNIIRPAHEKLKFTNSIQFMSGVSLGMKKEFKKRILNVPITPVYSIFQIIRSEIENN